MLHSHIDNGKPIMTMKKTPWFALILSLSLCAGTAWANDNSVDPDTPIPEPEPTQCEAESQTKALVKWKGGAICSIGGPAEVRGYRVRCQNATYLDFRIADGGFAGDHWQLKGKNWDNRPNTAVTTSPGGVFDFGVPARIYNYGGTGVNPNNIDAYIQCSYLHGIDAFGASSFIHFASDGNNCIIIPDGSRSRIDRMP